MREYKQLFGIPEKMWSWGLGLQNPRPSEFGQYGVVDIRPAGIEMHHQVEVVDENGFPLANIWVIFGFPAGGPDINLGVRQNYWIGSPAVLKGNAQMTPISGCVQHTFQQGGEHIWIWDIDEEGDLKLPSPIVTNCSWQRTPVGVFEHTGVKITFQRRLQGVVSIWQRVAELEKVYNKGAQTLVKKNARFHELLEKSDTEELTEAEENELLNLDSFLESTLNDHNALPLEKKSELAVGKLDELLNSTNELLKALKGQSD
jgi:hypothetical protein